MQNIEAYMYTSIKRFPTDDAVNPTTLLNKTTTEFSVSISKEELEREDNITCEWEFNVPQRKGLNVTVLLLSPGKKGCSQERLDIIDPEDKNLPGQTLISTHYSFNTGNGTFLTFLGRKLKFRSFVLSLIKKGQAVHSR